MGAAGVVAAGREHPAGVGADVPGPGLRDAQGAAAVQADAGVALRAQRDAVFLPHVPERGKSCSGERGRRGGVGAAGGGLSPGQVWSRELQRRAPGQGGAGGGHRPSRLRRGSGGAAWARSGPTSTQHPVFTPAVQVQVPAWLLLTRSHHQASQSGHKLFSQRG